MKQTKKQQGLDNRIGLKDGTKIVVTRDGCGHDIPIGKVIEVYAWNGSNYKVRDYTSHIVPSDFRLATITKTDLTAELGKLEEATLEVNRKLAFLKKTGLAEYDEELYKTYAEIQVLCGGASTLTKAKRIVEIRNG